MRRSSITSLQVFCKDFVEVSNENASFTVLLTTEDSIRLQLIYLSTRIAFWLVKYIFQVYWCTIDYLAQRASWGIYCWFSFISQISYYGKFMWLQRFNFDCFGIGESTQVKTSHESKRSKGFFSKRAAGTRMLSWLTSTNSI